MIRIVAIVVLSVTVAGDLPAFECRDYDEFLEASATLIHPLHLASQLCVYQHAAYVLADNQTTVTFFDISDLSDPRLVTGVAFDTIPTDLVAGPAGLLVTVPELGLIRFDLTDPLAPVAVDTLDLGVELSGVDLAGQTAYVAMGNAGARAVALDFPIGMIGVGSVSVPSSVNDVAIDGDWLYLATSTDGLVVIDAANRSALQFAGSATFANPAHFIEAGHGQVVVTGADPTFGHWWARAFDVTDPPSPQGAAAMDGLTRLTVRPTVAAADRVFLAAQDLGLREYAVAGGAFVPVGHLPGSYSDVHLDDGRVVILGRNLLETATAAPMPPAAIQMPGYSRYPIHRDGLVYSVRGSELTIVDVSDPAHPIDVSRTPIPDLHHSLPLALAGPVLYIGTWTTGLMMMDVADPLQPAIISTMPTANRADAMLVSDQVLYTIEEGYGLLVYDISTPLSPTPIGSAEIYFWCNGQLLLKSNQLIAGSNWDGAYLFDVADPAHPAHTVRLGQRVDAAHLMLHEDRLILGLEDYPSEVWRDLGGGNWLLDGEMPITSVLGAAVVGDVGYLIQGSGDLVALDMTAPVLPVRTGYIPTDLPPRGLLATDDWVLVVDTEQSHLYPPRCPPGVTAAPAVPALLSPVLTAAPNPFNPQTRLSFELPQAGRARLQIFDLRGRLVATLIDVPLAAGRHHIDWRGTDSTGRPVPSGVYHARLSVNGTATSLKVSLLK